MDNTDKINTEITHSEVSLFLGDEVKKLSQKKIDRYNLQEEYAKTSKNKAFFLRIALAICLLFIVVGSLAIAGVITRINHGISININSFDDLNLRILLNSAERVQSLYDNAVRAKQMLELEQEDALVQAELKRKMDLYTIQMVRSVTPGDELRISMVSLEKDYMATVKKIQDEYGQKLAEAEADIIKYKKQLDDYNERKRSAPQDENTAIDSTKQLHELEIASIRKQYENKISQLYVQLAEQQRKAAQKQKAAVEQVRDTHQAKINLLDPKAREQDSEQDKIIQDAGITKEISSLALWKTIDELSFDALDYTDLFSSTQFSMSVRDTQLTLLELSQLAERFKQIPMENSIKDYVPAMLIQTYRIADSLAEGGAELQKELKDFEDIAEVSLAEGTADGIILNAENAPSYTVYIARSRRQLVKDRALQAQIFKEDIPVANGMVTQIDKDYIIIQIPMPVPVPEISESPYSETDIDAETDIIADIEVQPPAPYHIIIGDRIKFILQEDEM